MPAISFAQVQIINDSESCVNEDFSIQTSPGDFDEYTWDFCPGDFDESVLPQTRLDMNAVSNQVDDITKARWNGNNYLFGLDLNGAIYSLAIAGSATTLIKSYNNPSNRLSNPRRIRTFYNGTEWVVFITNFSRNSIARCTLASLNSTLNLQDEWQGATIVSPFALDLVRQNNEMIVITGNHFDRTINLYNTGSDGMGSPAKINSLTAGSSVGNLSEIKMSNINGTWFMLVAGQSRIEIYNFGTDLSSTPTKIKELTQANIGFFDPRDIDLAYDNGKHILMIMSISGTLSYGEIDFPDGDYTYEHLYSDNVLTNTRSLTAVHDGSIWDLYSFNKDNKKLISLQFSNPCAHSIGQMDQAVVNSRYTKPGIHQIDGIFRKDGDVYYDRSTIQINGIRALDFTYGNTCENLATAFSVQLDEVGDNNTISYTWDFGDGSSLSNTENPSHTFASDGAYQVGLDVTTDCNEAIHLEQTVHIVDNDDLTADFNFPVRICSNNNIIFEENSTYTQDNPVRWLWKVDGQERSQEEDLELTFDHAGQFMIELQVTGASGCESSVSKTVEVTEGPYPSFTVNDACEESSISFNNQSTGQIKSYHWDFGNGTTSDIRDPVVQYSSPGQYLVALTLLNDAGCEVSVTSNVSVYENPTASFSHDLACKNAPVTFFNESVSTDANIVSSTWNFGDAGSADNTSTEMQPEHIFSESGDYLVTLTTATNFDCESSVTQTVHILESPTAVFSYGDACIGEPVKFQDASYGVNGTDVTAWAWDLGGTFSSQRNPEKIFDFPLDYPISLTVTGDNQCTNTLTKVLTIYPEPELDFTVSQSCVGAPTLFIDQTPAGPSSVIGRVWDFGGLGQSGDSLTSFTFPRSGNYLVSLEQELNDGCSYSLTRTVTISDPPEVSFTLETEFGGPPFTIQATNTSDDGLAFSWYLDDVLISEEKDLNYVINETGTYQLSLTGTNDQGCAISTTATIQVITPEIDLGIAGLNMPTGEGSMRVSLTNTGNIFLQEVLLTFDFGNSYEVQQAFDIELPPDGQPVLLEIPLSFARPPQDAFCISLPDSISGVPDINPDNNSVCYTDDGLQVYAPYPNPASERLHFVTQTTQKLDLQINIYDSRGEEVTSIFQEQIPVGSKEWTVDTSSFASGMYIVQFVTTGRSTYYKVVIQR